MEGSEQVRGQVELMMDGRRSPRPARLATVVVDELADRIVSGSLPEGTVLPTEDALCKEFGFSRTVMREGLKLLEERGLIRVEQGRGTTVQPRASWNLLDPEVLQIALTYDRELVLLNDLMEVRRLLEGDMARAAATRLTDEQLAMLAENVEQMRRSIKDYPEFRRLDLAFHATLMIASGSEIGLTIVGTIHRHAGVRPPQSSPGTPASLRRTANEHQGILDALTARDGELAAKLISAHIDSAWAERRAAAAAR